jgi:hypothetical protein
MCESCSGANNRLVREEGCGQERARTFIVFRGAYLTLLRHALVVASSRLIPPPHLPQVASEAVIQAQVVPAVRGGVCDGRVSLPALLDVMRTAVHLRPAVGGLSRLAGCILSGLAGCTKRSPWVY